jgi:hypothetical protein
MTFKESAKEELIRFLGDPTRKVLVLQGPWGIGKTYFWRQFLADHATSILEPVHSYVSLFGASQSSQLKSTILANSSAKGADAVKLQAAKLAGKLTKLTKNVDIAYLKQGHTILSNLVQGAEQMLIKNWLICFDDLERRLPQFSMTEFLGLVSQLKEERECRIVLIFNQGMLTEVDKKDFDRFREKVVDAVFSYAPLLSDNLSLVFSKTEAAVVEPIFQGLELNNIRVMQQSKWAVEYFEPHLGELSEMLAKDVRLQVVKLACLFYGFSDKVPLDELKDYSWLRSSLLDKKKPEYTEFLEKIEFGSERYDSYIFQFLRNGYCDLDSLKKDLSELNRGFTHKANLAEFRSIYGLLNDNFRVETPELLRRSRETLDKQSTHVPVEELLNLLPALKMFGGTGWDKYGKNALLAAIKTAHEESLSRLQALSKWPEVNKLIKKRRSGFRKKLSVEKLMIALAGSNGWDPADFGRLDEFSADEIYRYLVSSKYSRLQGLTRELLRAFSDPARGDPNSAPARVLNKFKTALEKIGKRSSLDTWRVSHILKVIPPTNTQAAA